MRRMLLVTTALSILFSGAVHAQPSSRLFVGRGRRHRHPLCRCAIGDHACGSRRLAVQTGVERRVNRLPRRGYLVTPITADGVPDIRCDVTDARDDGISSRRRTMGDGLPDPKSHPRRGASSRAFIRYTDVGSLARRPHRRSGQHCRAVDAPATCVAVRVSAQNGCHDDEALSAAARRSARNRSEGRGRASDSRHRRFRDSPSSIRRHHWASTPPRPSRCRHSCWCGLCT